MNKFSDENYISPVLLFLLFTLTACGGGGNQVSGVSQGQFVDSAVEGITYTSGKETGLTNASGSFSYETGKTVTFSIGDIVIGTVTGSSIVTPVQLVANATDQTHTVVTNIVQFLITIDDDHDPSNGIQITQAIRDAATGLTVDFTLSDFDTNGEVSAVIGTLTTASTLGNQVLITNFAAQNHLGDTLSSLLTGTYSGTFSGVDRGTWTMIVAANGSITGTGTSTTTNVSLTFSGNIITSGAVAATGAGGGSGSNWVAAVNIATGGVTGVWEIIGAGQSGTFTGSKN